MKYENFNDFFPTIDSYNKEIMSQWEELSKKKKHINTITFIIILIADIIMILIFKTITFFTIIPLLVMDIFIYVIAQLVTDQKEVSKFNEDYKYNIINKMLENFIDELDYIPKKSLPYSIYNEAKYGGYYNKFYSDDYFEGKINNQKIIMADLLVEKEETKKDSNGNEETDTVIIFNGLFGKINLDKSINSVLNITKNGYFSYLKANKLDMDHFEFEKSFDVYTSNNIIAMQLLTADIQDDILELYNKYKINFNISINNNTMYVLFDTGNMFEVFSTRKNPNKVLEQYFDIMNFIYKLVNKIIKAIDSTPI